MEIRYWVNCFDRELVIKFPDDYKHLEKEILKMLEDYYMKWHSPEDIKDEEERRYVEDSCCEEYMMERLSETYNVWEEWWVEDENEDPIESEHTKNNLNKEGDEMTKEMLDANWLCSSYNEDTPEELIYYAESFAPEDIAYLYNKEDDSISMMEVVASIFRSDDIVLYDKLVEDNDVLINGEKFYDADTSAEFIYDDDCVLVWFKYIF